LHLEPAMVPHDSSNLTPPVPTPGRRFVWWQTSEGKKVSVCEAIMDNKIGKNPNVSEGSC
jgi:hypothetical protein